MENKKIKTLDKEIVLREADRSIKRMHKKEKAVFH